MSLTVLITGGSSGIGKAAAKQCFGLGYTVIITGRSQTSLDKAEESIVEGNTGKLYKVVMDLSVFRSIQKAVETIESLVTSLDVIVHNAAQTDDEFIQFCDGEAEGTFFVNAIAPLYLNRLLMPLFEKSTNPNKRILFVASGLHDPTMVMGGHKNTAIPESVEVSDFVGDSKTYDAQTSYALSKLGCVWNAYILNEKYPSVPVIAFCPGLVPTTGLARKRNEEFKERIKEISKIVKVITEEEAADCYIYYITSPEVEKEGGKFFSNKELLESSPDSHNKKKQDTYLEYANKIIDIKLKEEK